jgi:rubrerythrin
VSAQYQMGAQPTDEGDAAIAALAERVELTAVEAYEQALRGETVTTAPVRDVLRLFAAHHRAHARAFAAAAGDAATGRPDRSVGDEVARRLEAAGDEAAALEALFGLEQTAAATHLFALGALRVPETLRLTASILPVESQHVAVLGATMGKPIDQYVPDFESQDAAVETGKSPVSP